MSWPLAAPANDRQAPRAIGQRGVPWISRGRMPA